MLLGKEVQEFVASALMDDEKAIDAAAAEDTKVVEGKDGLAAQTGRCMLGGDEDAERLRGCRGHEARAPKTR